MSQAEHSIKLAASAAVISILVLCGTLILAVENYVFKQAPKDTVSLQSIYESSIALHLVKARKFSAEGSWQEATTVYQKVLDKDPLHPEARKGLKNALRNQSHQFILKNAQRAFERGKSQEVLEKLKEIQPTDHYFLTTKRLRQKAAVQVIEASTTKAIEACSDRRWRTCHQASVNILKLESTHPQGRELLREAEMQMKRARVNFIPWQPAN